MAAYRIKNCFDEHAGAQDVLPWTTTMPFRTRRPRLLTCMLNPHVLRATWLVAH